MLRTIMIALFASASVAMLAPDAASAHGGFHNGFRHRRFPFAVAAVGLGLGYGYYNDYYDYGYPYYGSYDDSYYYGDSGGCYIVRRSVLTPYGWRIRPVQVCG